MLYWNRKQSRYHWWTGWHRHTTLAYSSVHCICQNTENWNLQCIERASKYESCTIKCTIKRRLLLTLCDVHATKHGILNSYPKKATNQASVADKNDFLTVYHHYSLHFISPDLVWSDNACSLKVSKDNTQKEEKNSRNKHMLLQRSEVQYLLHLNRAKCWHVKTFLTGTYKIP